MISPLENNNMVIRAQDYSTVRQNELSQPQTTHMVIQEQLDSKEEANVHTVRTKDNSDKADTHHDAKEEGRNKYYPLRKKKSMKDELDDGIVVAKLSGGFNITV